MDIICGDKVKYFFPEPVEGKEAFITGTIETITDDYVFLMSDEKVRMKISFKNFHLIRHFIAPELKFGV